jgi:integrase/recombinase XerD
MRQSLLSPIGGSRLCHSIYKPIRSNRSSPRPIWRLRWEGETEQFFSCSRRLGLRASDIVQLRLDDLDWREGMIRVSGKGRRQTVLPMTQEVGDALAAYIKDHRPQADTDAVFVRSSAPYRAFTDSTAISILVARAMRRTGINCPKRGAAHILRHSVASSMLRQGVSLQEIAGVLRHRSVATTKIYAKVDVITLRQVAQPWPEVKAC